MTNLDRRAALTMGLEISPLTERGRGVWIEFAKSGPPIRSKPWSPTTDANDCREFKQYGITRGLFYLTSEREHSFVVDILRAGDVVKWVAKCETTKEEHGATFDLVACVIAILAALEAQND